MSRRQLDLFGPGAGVGMLDAPTLRAAVDLQAPVGPALGRYVLPAPLPPEQAHLERYRCPVCSNDGMPHCVCDGVGHISRDKALAFLRDFPDLPMGPRLAVPPAMLDEPCADCAFRGDSPERDGGHLPQIQRGPEFYCHVGMPVDGKGRYQPLCQTAAGQPIGHPLCAGWLASARRMVAPVRASALTAAAHRLAIKDPALSPRQLWTQMELSEGPARAAAWLSYQHAVKALHQVVAAPPSYPAAWSPCKAYRYALWRWWGPPAGPYMAVIGLNPSTADENKDDPTLRRCIHFARREGCAALVMVNLFAFRATQPRVMKEADEPIGPDNDRILREVCGGAAIVVAAWGDDGAHESRSTDVEYLLVQAGIKPRCFGWTKSGQPRHPLYQANDAPLVTFGLG